MKLFNMMRSHHFIVVLLIGILFLISTAWGNQPSLLKLEWQYGIYGSGIGKTGISVFDIDNDGILEMVMGGSTSTFGSNDFWYVVKQTGLNSYDQIWLSDKYSTSVNRIAVSDVDADGIGEIYVGLSDGTVEIYNGLTMAKTASFKAGSAISALVVADVDSDGIQEIVTSDYFLGNSNPKIYIYSALTLAQEWISTAYGGNSLAVGNVDTDNAPEIVTTTNGGHGYVIDGVSHILEWDYINSFGNLVELGDIDSDGMNEIIGAASWYRITTFDADIKTPKWEIITSNDISALYVTDINNDGVPEILYSDNQSGGIHCYNAVTKTEIWSINNPSSGSPDITSGDVDNDGVVEVIWGVGANTTGSDHLCIANTITRQIEWQSMHIDGPLSAVDVGDVDDDGQDEIVMVSFESNSGYSSGIIHVFDATTHLLEWRTTLNVMDSMGVRSVKIADVDNDGETEFVITTANINAGVIQVYNGKTHILERQSAGYWGNYFTALAIGDVDNDGKTEIVAGQGREHTGALGVYIVVFDGATLMEKWKSVDLGSYWGKVYDIELADIDKDGNAEIIASLAGEKIYVYDGVTHQLDWLAAIPAYALEVFDIDNDSVNEILIGKNNGIVEVYNGLTFTLKSSYTLGSGNIIGLLVDDINQSGGLEWLVSDGNRLSVFNGETKNIMWQSNNLGSSPGNFNHINSRDIDNDGNKEIVLGSSFALYQFEVLAGAYPDFDNDGYTSDTDCNDNAPNINPGIADTNCNGIDENCSGAADEGYLPTPTSCGQGVCVSTGQLICQNGSTQDTCTPGTPQTEVCDGIDNNCDGLTDEGNVCGTPDLLVSSWTAPANACAGASISIKDTTNNQGTGTAGASQTCLYFSTNTTLDVGDTPLGCRAIPSLGASAVNTGTTSVTLPNVAIGKYYLIAMADDGKVVTESNETNNKKSKTIYIGPDLYVSALSAPTSATLGATISITDTTKNKGCGTAGASTTKFYLSTNTTINIGVDYELGTRLVPALGTNAVSTGATSVIIPAGIPTGKYYIIANSDDAKVVVEGNETNNKKTKAITINP